jgi:hypothetical protein
MRGSGGGAAAATTTTSPSSRLPAAAPGSAGARQQQPHQHQQQHRRRPAHPSYVAAAAAAAADADAAADAAAVKSSSSSSSPSLFQLVAMARCYRTMVPTWMWLPKQLLAWPTVVTLTLRVVRPFHGSSSSSTATTAMMLMLMLLAAVTTILFLWLRKRLDAASSLSSSPSTRIQGRRQPARRLAFVGFGVVAVVAAAYQVVASLLAPAVIGNNYQDAAMSPGAAAEQAATATLAASLMHTAGASLRWSLAAALLGWTVLGRYAGPRSCHRMSSCLLGAFPPLLFSRFDTSNNSNP